MKSKENPTAYIRLANRLTPNEAIFYERKLNRYFRTLPTKLSAEEDYNKKQIKIFGTIDVKIIEGIEKRVPGKIVYKGVKQEKDNTPGLTHDELEKFEGKRLEKIVIADRALEQRLEIIVAKSNEGYQPVIKRKNKQRVKRSQIIPEILKIVNHLHPYKPKIGQLQEFLEQDGYVIGYQTLINRTKEAVNGGLVGKKGRFYFKIQ